MAKTPLCEIVNKHQGYLSDEEQRERTHTDNFCN